MSEPPKPLTWTQAFRQFSGVMLHSAALLFKRVPGQNVFVTDAQWCARIKCCSACEHLSEQGRCKLCHCPVRRAAQWSLKPCPAGKWPALKPE